MAGEVPSLFIPDFTLVNCQLHQLLEKLVQIELINMGGQNSCGQPVLNALALCFMLSNCTLIQYTELFEICFADLKF